MSEIDRIYSSIKTAPKEPITEDGEVTESLSMSYHSKAVTSLCCYLKNGDEVELQYTHMGASGTRRGNKFWFLFIDQAHRWKLTVTGHGSKFAMAFHLIRNWRCATIREATGEAGKFSDDDPVFTEIAIQEVTPVK